MLESALESAIGAQFDVVRNAILIVHGHQTLSQSKRDFLPVPNSFSAPFSPVEFGRRKTQFCQAERRPKTFVSMLSAPGKRRLASMPVSASGERLHRSSMAMRSSSSQSSSSGATVIRPTSRASADDSNRPDALASSAS